MTAPSPQPLAPTHHYTARASGGIVPVAGEPTEGAGSLLISSLSSLPGLKYGTFFGGTSTLSPVFGLRPFRGSRLRRRKLPNPRSSIFSPRCSASTMLLKTVSTMTSESFLVRSDTRETSSTSSALVIEAGTSHDGGSGVLGFWVLRCWVLRFRGFGLSRTPRTQNPRTPEPLLQV